MLTIGFLLDLTAGHPTSELELAGYASDSLEQAIFQRFGEPVNGSLIIDGSVSVLLDGRELLGDRYWFYFLAFNCLSNLVCRSESEHFYFGQQSHGIMLVPAAGGVQLQIEVRPSQISHRHLLPFQELVSEWCLMEFRLARVLAHLGDVTAALKCRQPEQWLECTAYDQLIDEDRLNYTLSAPLPQLLRSPFPN
jgi:hypothetical protein